MIRKATIEDTKRLLEIYAYYVKNTAITFEYDVLKIPQSVPRLLSHPVTEQINSLSLDRPEATSAPLAC